MEEQQIQLDGSFGTGPDCEVTIITKDGDKEFSKTYTFPYTLVDEKVLMAYNRLNLILGYEIIKKGRPSPLKELGL